MNKEEINFVYKEIIEELKETEYQLNQYRLLTNKLVNENISQHNIEKFKEDEYIENTDKHYMDYEYDLYSWLDSSLIKRTIEELEYLDNQVKKYKEVIDKAINNSQYWIDYYTRLNSDERIALRLQENIDILKEVK